MASYDDEPKAIDREPSLRDRLSRLEKAKREQDERLAELREQVHRLAREVGID